MSYNTPNLQNDIETNLNSAPSIQSGEELQQVYVTDLDEFIESDNICELLDEVELKQHAIDLTDKIDKDRETMQDYLRQYDRALNLAKLDPESRSKSFPFVGASNLVMPYVMEAALDFNSRAAPALLERRNICKIDVNGYDPEGVKKARGERVAQAINTDLRSMIDGWRESVDKALLLLPIVGTYFRKTWQNPSENKRESQLIYPDDLIFDHTNETFEAALRKSYEYRMNKNEVVAAIRSGVFCNIDMEQYKDDDSIEFIESHCWLDLDDDGYCEPYIVNLEKNGNQNIVSIVARYDADDVYVNNDNEISKITAEEFFTQTIFIPDPEGGCMGIGWGILLGDTFDAINTSMNQLIDAGTLQVISANSGFIRIGGRNGRQRKSVIKMQMGGLTPVEGSGQGPLRDDIVQAPFAGPSPVLLQMMDNLKLEMRATTTSGQGVEPMPNEAAEMYLARLREAQASGNSIMGRVFQGVSKELKRIYEIMGRYLGQEAYLDLVDDPECNWVEDFTDNYDICTTADPSQGSEMERMSRAQIIYDEAKTNPAIDIRAAAADWLDALGVKNEEKYMPKPEPQQPDPLQQIQAQAVATMSEAEKMKAEADIMEAQAKMIDAQIKMAKADSEIQKLEAETLETLSVVDKNERETALKTLKEQRESFSTQFEIIQGQIRDHYNRRAEDARIGTQAVPEQSNVQRIPSGI